MRITIDYRDDLMFVLQERAAQENLTLKDEVNACLERGLGMDKPSTHPWTPLICHLGGTRLDLGNVWEMVAELESQAYTVKRDLQK